jgi:hypothetical protein
MKVMGSRVLLTIPPAPETTIELTDEVKEALYQEYLQQLKSLEVYAVGEDVTKVVPGDKVYVAPSIAAHGDKVIIDDQVKLILGERDIAIIWE